LHRDMAWVGRLYETSEIPKDKRYLLKYFSNPLQEAVLRYQLVFGDTKNFVDHTGIVVQERWLKTLRERMEELEEAKKTARALLDFTKLAEIESGDYKAEK